jgi:hypothetical protein
VAAVRRDGQPCARDARAAAACHTPPAQAIFSAQPRCVACRTRRHRSSSAAPARLIAVARSAANSGSTVGRSRSGSSPRPCSNLLASVPAAELPPKVELSGWHL